MRTKQLILPVATVGCLAYAAISIANTTPTRTLTDPPQAPPRSPFDSSIAASGLIEPASENIAIGTPISGLVEKVEAAAGQWVRKGQPLFVIDHRQLDSQKRVSQARITRQQSARSVTQALLDQARRRFASAKSLADSRAISAEETADRGSEVARLDAELMAATADIELAEAELAAIQTDIDRSTVCSPIDATVLQVRIREGEFIDSSTSANPRFIIGRTESLHIRTDIDEFEIPRLVENAVAKASPRGNAASSYDLEFIRYEPFVIPKQSLTGDSIERVDTRVLQAIYKIKSPDAAIFPGQQVDVFIQAKPRETETSSFVTK